MDGIPKSIWRVPAYMPHLQPNLTQKILADAEERLGVRLPGSYIAILQQQNGGYVRLVLPETTHSQIWGIGPHFPNIAEELWWKERDAEEDGVWLPENRNLLVPFDGDGHWYLCFDYRNGKATAEPKITFLDLECEREEAIAKDFGSFLSILREDVSPNTCGILGIHTLV